MATRLNTGLMPTTRSAVPVVKRLDLRDINNSVSAINQQLDLLNKLANEANLKAGQAQLTNSQGSISLTQLQQQIALLQSQIAAITTFSAVVTLRADTAIATNDIVYPTSNGGVSPVDTQDPTAIFGVTGVAVAAVAAGGNVEVRRFGPMDIDGAEFEVGRAVYAQVGGGLTQYPQYAAVALPIGVAATETVLEVRPGYPALLEAPAYSTVEDFMPVTLWMIRTVYDLVNTIIGQPDGIVVKVGDQLITREIVTPSGSGLNVFDGDGVMGNPSIS